MYNTIIILLIIHYILFFITKPKISTLSCGIFGWSGKDVKEFNKDKLNILGLANQERGEDSCGIGVNGDIFIGINNTKLFSSFIKQRYHENEIYTPKRIKSVIGHTRNASAGSINVENAHPFGFGSIKEKYAFMGVHNGTLYNKEELIEEFEIRPTRKIDKNERHTKIDSEVLLECIYKSANFKVLSKYRGAAAVAFVNLKTPTKLYLFRGYSTKHNYEQDERPLHVYKENKNSMYFSSIVAPLYYIGGTEDTVMEILHNVVYEITNGDISKAKKYIIDRSDSSQNMYDSSSSFSRKRKKTEKKYKQVGFVQEPRDEDYYESFMGSGNGRFSGINSGYELDLDEEVRKHDLDDSIDSKDPVDYEDKVKDYVLTCSTNLRYYTPEDKLATGIYVNIPGIGLKFLDTNLTNAKKRMKFIAGKYFYNDSFKSIIENDKYANEAFIPFQVCDNLEKHFLYFHQGCLLREDKDYFAAEILAINSPLSINGLSECSVNPVMEISADRYKKEVVVYNTKKFSGKVIPLGGNKTFYVHKGNLKKIRTRKLVPPLGATHRPSVFVIPAWKDEIKKSINSRKIKKEINDMAIKLGNTTLEQAILALDTLKKELNPVKETKIAEKINDAFGKCENILYAAYDDIEGPKK